MPHPPTKRLLWWRDGQHGVVRVPDLRAAGLDGSAVASGDARGVLHLQYPGVYSVGHAVLSREGRWLAAVFAGRPRRGAEPPVGGRAVEPHPLRAARARRARQPPPSAGRRNPLPQVPTTPSPRCNEVPRHPGNHRRENPRRPDRHPRPPTNSPTSSTRPSTASASASKPPTKRCNERTGGRTSNASSEAITDSLNGSAGTRSRNEREFLKLLKAARLPEAAREHPRPRHRSRLRLARPASSSPRSTAPATPAREPNARTEQSTRHSKPPATPCSEERRERFSRRSSVDRDLRLSRAQRERQGLASTCPYGARRSR